MLTERIIDQATDFHEHLGPFLIIIVRMGLTGLNILDTRTKDEDLKIVASLPFRVPFSCIIDGFQVVTKCTVGNQKLTLRDSEEIQAEFRRSESGQKIVVTFNNLFLEKLKAQLQHQDLADCQIRQLAYARAAGKRNLQHRIANA